MASEAADSKRRKTTPTKDNEARNNPVAVLFSADIIFLLSEMLQGEYALSTLPLICKTTASARLSLNLCEASFNSSSSSPFSPFRPTSPSSSSFKWSREAFFYSIPSRHSIHSIQLNGDHLFPNNSDDNDHDDIISWLANRAPKLERLTVSKPDYEPGSGFMRIKEYIPNDLLKSLNIPYFFAEDADSLSSLPHLTRLHITALHGRESVLLKAVWQTPLLSLRIGYRFLGVVEEGEKGEKRKNEQRATPPRFATTLRELQCGEESMDTLSLYCWQLERLYCRRPRGLVDVNPKLVELHISHSPQEVVLTLDHLLALETLNLGFQGFGCLLGTVRGNFRNLRHANFHLVNSDSVIALLSSSRTLESVRLGSCPPNEVKAYMKYFTCSQFPKDNCAVYWESLREDNMRILLEAGVQLHGTCVVHLGRFTIPPGSYLTKCTVFDFHNHPVDLQLITSMTSLSTVRLRLEDQYELWRLLRLVPSLTEVDTSISSESFLYLYLDSQNLRFLKISFLDITRTLSTTISGHPHHINLPRLRYLNISGLETGFAGPFLSELFSAMCIFPPSTPSSFEVDVGHVDTRMKKYCTPAADVLWAILISVNWCWRKCNGIHSICKKFPI